MLKNISLGMYFPGNSLLHRLQARTKLLALICIVACLTIADHNVWHFAPFIAVILLLGMSVALSRVSPRELWHRLWLLLLLTLIGALSTLFVSNGTNDINLYTFGPYLPSYALAREVLLMCAGVLLVLFCVSLLPLFRRVKHLFLLKLLRILLGVLTFVALLFLWLIHAPSPTQIFPIGPFSITQSGVWTLLSFTVVLTTLYTFSLLLTMTTSPIALVEGLTMLLAPLRRLRLPVDDFALMALIALRFIPTLLEEVEQLLKAQAARGADVARGTLRERLQSLMMLFIPLMQGVLRRASELSIALEARGYEVEGQQTRLYEKPLSTADYVVLSVVVLSMAAALLV